MTDQTWGVIDGKGSGGALGGTRTHGLSLRRAALYPTELQAHNKMVSWPNRDAGAEGGIRTHTPVRILRPERSASTVPPLRPIIVKFPRSGGAIDGACGAGIQTGCLWWAIEDLNLGPLACEASALTTELIAQIGSASYCNVRICDGQRQGYQPHGGNDRVRTCDLALMKRPLYR